MREFDYVRPDTLEGAVGLLTQPDSLVRPLAGGTDLLPMLKADLVQPGTLVDIKRLPELSSRIDVSAGGIRIGALARLSLIEKDARLGAQYSALSQAAGLAATPQLRNMATIAGNLVQRPRCWYFRSPHFTCWLKGGSTCQAREGENTLHAIFDESPCVAVHPSDPAVALVALDASVQTTSRDLPISEFFTMPRDDHRQETVLRPDELIVSLTLPSLSDGWRSTYRKAMNRQVWAFALVSVAAAVRVQAGQIADARVVLGGVAPAPWRAHQAERVLVGNAPSEDLFSATAAAALADAHPLSHNAYKATLAQGMIRQALAALTQSTQP